MPRDDRSAHQIVIAMGPKSTKSSIEGDWDFDRFEGRSLCFGRTEDLLQQHKYYNQTQYWAFQAKKAQNSLNSSKTLSSISTNDLNPAPTPENSNYSLFRDTLFKLLEKHAKNLIYVDFKGDFIDHLDLNDGQQFTDKFCSLLVKIIENGKLKELKITKNYTFKKRVGTICEALEKSQNNSLRSLDFSLTCMREAKDSFLPIASFVKSNTSLVSLNLYSTWMEDEGAVAIGNALKYNRSIVSLQLGGNLFGLVGAKALHSSLWLNPKIKKLSLLSTGETTKIAWEIHKMVEMNTILWPFIRVSPPTPPQHIHFDRFQ